MESTIKSAISATAEMKIGKVNYIVTAHYNPEARETAEDKYLRYITERVAEELKRSKTAVNS